LYTFERQLLGFVDCVRSRRTPEPSIDDGIRVVQGLDAARTSAQRGGREVVMST
jgi:hypothetical protein